LHALLLTTSGTGSISQSNPAGAIQITAGTAVSVGATPPHLAFIAPPPASVIAGAAIGSAGIKVAVESSSGAVLTGNSSTVTLTLHGGTFTHGTTTASATAVNGLATFTGLAIDTAATGYTLTASDSSRAVTSATSPAFNIVPGPITPKAVIFRATVGHAATAAVATFTVPDLYAVAGNFTASIIWGDAQTSVPGVIVKNSAGKFTVSGTHMYSALSPKAGYTIKVTIRETGGLASTITTTGIVTAAPLVAMTLPAMTATVNTTMTTKAVAAFQDHNSLHTSAATYTGTIAWGDGSSSTATFKLSSTTAAVATFWHVIGTHKYTRTGTFTVIATIKEPAANLTLTLKTVVHVV
jgi:hypothetical protein